ncbi:unnamed protein product [Acanthoscelides obtectus]|uniref:Uncharacterized protein n=1 Tax=Acanthoscelides obtectus TaxID=200917 RepID=A0A9P0KJH9_ACAOB|nr:unnamed protein product [Acanthoscelides obtectus]CAK1662888.1 hypothetical protein AOBTE_LOCUS23364 [Acanthoscelides obtectus]
MPFSAFVAYFSGVGVTDLVHLSEKIKKHENSKTHLHNSMELALSGTVNIRAQLDSAYWRNIQQHNDTVTKNRREETEPAQVKTGIDNFAKYKERNKIGDIINEAKSICTEPQGNKRRRRNNSSHDHRVAALEVCDNIVNSANDRFQFKDHTVAASLFSPNTLENTVDLSFFKYLTEGRQRVSILVYNWSAPSYHHPCFNHFADNIGITTEDREAKKRREKVA